MHFYLSPINRLQIINYHKNTIKDLPYKTILSNVQKHILFQPTRCSLPLIPFTCQPSLNYKRGGHQPTWDTGPTGVMPTFIFTKTLSPLGLVVKIRSRSGFSSSFRRGSFRKNGWIRKEKKKILIVFCFKEKESFLGSSFVCIMLQLLSSTYVI